MAILFLLKIVLKLIILYLRLHNCYGTQLLPGLLRHGKVMDFLEFLEKSWNFDKKLTESWKSHGIFILEQKVMEKSWNFTNKFLILINQHHYAAAFQN